VTETDNCVSGFMHRDVFAGLLRIKLVPSNSVRWEAQLPGVGRVATQPG